MGLYKAPDEGPEKFFFLQEQFWILQWLCFECKRTASGRLLAASCTCTPCAFCRSRDRCFLLVLSVILGRSSDPPCMVSFRRWQSMVPMTMRKDMRCRLFSSSFDWMLPAAEREHVGRLIKAHKRGRSVRSYCCSVVFGPLPVYL